MVCMGTCVGRRHVYQIDTYNLSKRYGWGVGIVSIWLSMVPVPVMGA